MPFCHLTLTSKKPKDFAYPTEFRTLGDHLRKRRLDLGLLQREVAERLRGTVCSVRNWERNEAKPEVRFLPLINEFLGYEPEGSAASFPEALRASRRAVGLSQRQFARRCRWIRAGLSGGDGVIRRSLPCVAQVRQPPFCQPGSLSTPPRASVAIVTPGQVGK